MSKEFRTAFLVTAAVCLVFGGIALWGGGAGAPDAQPAPQDQTAPAQEPPAPVTFTLVAAGDNLIHDLIYNQASRRAGGDGFDFAAAYEQVAPLLLEGDLCFVNQETPLASQVAPLSNYPRFNSPTQVGDQLVAMGVDVVNHANNHMFDQGEAGLAATMDYWESQPSVLFVGAWREEGEMDTPRICEVQGVRVAFVAATEHTNGLTLPRETAMRYLRCDETELLKEQVALARQQADVVVVSLHWGYENTTEVNEAQQALAQLLADEGVDLILGHHSHTLQPVQRIRRADGGETVVCYSLGNFISAMQGAYNMLGGVVRVQISAVPGSGEAGIEAVEMVPVVTDYAPGRDVSVIPLSAYTPELAASHGVRAYDGNFSYAYLQALFAQTIDRQFAPADLAGLYS